MEQFDSISEMTQWSRCVLARGKTIALVPTMGSFHEGHLSLMRQASELAHHVIVSLFVNPIQFGPDEDFARYPRDTERDAAMAKTAGVAVLFTPTAQAMYPPGNKTRVSVKDLLDVLCGALRPGHFEGVTTVVAKLFHIVQPRVALFGQKDFQQLAIIRRMVEDLDWDIQIVGHPIVREKDGLAMSSRNIYLSDVERRQAIILSQALTQAKEKVRSGMMDVNRIIGEIQNTFFLAPGVTTDYVKIIHGNSLQASREVDKNSVLALAVKIGNTRLIDNCYLIEDTP